MKAPDIRYECPHSLVDALELIAGDSHFSQPLAGGQSLMPMMHLRMAQPEVLIDLNRIPELDFITQEDHQIHIGAMMRYAALLDSALVRKHLPLLSLAIPHIAHAAVRNRGTIGGSVALADPAAEMPAVLKALDATIVVVSQDGQREIAADDFFIGLYETALGETELVHSVKIPMASAEQRFGFYELTRRHGDYALAGVAVRAQSVDPYTGLRIVFFGVGDHAMRAGAAESTLEGCGSQDDAALQRAQQSLAALDICADATTSVETRLQWARVVLKRALHSL